MKLALLWTLALSASLIGCTSLPPPEAIPSRAIAADPHDGLGRIAAQSLPDGLGFGSAFRPLPMAEFSMDARLALVRRARHSVDLQYYLVQDDQAGRILLRALRDAAQRGVRVRLLVDDLYTANSSKLLQGLAAHPNVEVRLFNPFAGGRAFMFTRFAFSVFDFARVNQRMHNKLFIADGAFAIAGGRNIADEYFRHSADGNFIDFDLLMLGEVVPELSASFDRYWNNRRAYPLHAIEPAGSDAASLQADFEQHTRAAEAAFPLPAAESADPVGYAPLSADIERPPLRLSFGRIRAKADDPEKAGGGHARRTDSVSAHFLQACTTSKSRVLLASPYFIPGEIGLDALREVRGRGTRVEVLTNALAANDEPFASAAYGRYRRPMLQMGVDLYEVSSRQLKTRRLFSDALGRSTGRSHAKLAVFDGHTVFVGSMNMDLRSARENTELGLFVESPELAAQVAGVLDLVRTSGSYRLRLAAPGDRVQWVAPGSEAEAGLDDEPEVELATRLKVLLFSPFIPEGLL